MQEAYQKDRLGFQRAAHQYRGENPDRFTCPDINQAGQIAQQARKSNIKFPSSVVMVGIPPPSGNGKDAMNGCYFSNHYSVRSDQDVQKFRQLI